MKAVYIYPEQIGMSRYTQAWCEFVNYVTGHLPTIQNAPEFVVVVPILSIHSLY